MNFNLFKIECLFLLGCDPLHLMSPGGFVLSMTANAWETIGQMLRPLVIENTCFPLLERGGKSKKKNKKKKKEQEVSSTLAVWYLLPCPPVRVPWRGVALAPARSRSAGRFRSLSRSQIHDQLA